MERLRQFIRAKDGSAIVEFAMLAPTICALLLGTLQMGIMMHSYNALRGISSDVERYAVVNYQTKNKLSNDQLTAYARSVAINAPYNLQGPDLSVAVATPANQRVDGATELTLTTTYSVRSVLRIVGMGDIPMTFSRSIFLLS